MNATKNSDHEFRFMGQDGLQIACSRWQSRGPVRGVVQIADGMGEHSGRYSELIAALQEAGFVVYANDHRGHGMSAIAKLESAISPTIFTKEGGTKCSMN